MSKPQSPWPVCIAMCEPNQPSEPFRANRAKKGPRERTASSISLRRSLPLLARTYHGLTFAKGEADARHRQLGIRGSK